MYEGLPAWGDKREKIVALINKYQMSLSESQIVVRLLTENT